LYNGYCGASHRPLTTGLRVYPYPRISRTQPLFADFYHWLQFDVIDWYVVIRYGWAYEQ